MADHSPPRLSIILVSACAMAYEVLLTRLFSIIQWHHFAFMIISLALLGYGASGTFLTVTSRYLLSRFPRVYSLNVALFGGLTILCYLLAQQVPFNAQEVIWDPRQFFYLGAIYLLLALPFFFAANAIGLAMLRFRRDIPRLYAADLLGAGAGAVGAIGLLFFLFPQDVLRTLATLGLATAALTRIELGSGRRVAYLFLVAAVIPLLLPDSWLRLHLSPYKGLNQALRVAGTKQIYQDSSPLGLLNVVESSEIPLRHAPGLSLTSAHEPPAQLGVFTDGDGMTVINQHADDQRALAYLDDMTSAAAFHLRSVGSVLVLGAGGGSQVLQALYHDAAHITAVEMNPLMVDLVKERYAEFSGDLYDDQRVSVSIAEARGFMTQSIAKYDLIQVAMLDAFAASAAGLHALHENYLYTVEALQAYLTHLAPSGILAITRWVKLPPRDNLKLFATAVSALRHTGAVRPGDHLLLIRNWQTATLLISRRAWGQKEIRSLTSFCASRHFDLAYYPGIPSQQANRFNRLPRAYFYNAATSLLGPNAERYLAEYKFNLQPATDDKPFFSHFLKWSSLPEVFALLGRGGMSLLEVGYLVLIATLLQASSFSFILILLPLLWWRKDQVRPQPLKFQSLKIIIFFFLLGLAFLFVEIAFIQKFILLLHHPLYAVAVVLTAFLVFAGMGSGFSNQYLRSGRWRIGIQRATIAIILLGLLYARILDPLFNAIIAWSTPWKIIISLLLIAPLAFFMGMPFPLGMSLLGELSMRMVPWGWGINGCASVLSAILTTLLALHFGFTAVVLLALICYGLAGALILAIGDHRQQGLAQG